MSHFADSLKTLRQSSNLTMQELADKASVSKSMISKIEREDVQPTLDVAARLARALDKSLSEMLHSAHTTQVVFLPRKEQAVWEDASHVKRRNISPVFAGLKLEWLHIEMPKGTVIQKAMSLCKENTEKMVMVIKGTLELIINKQVYRLNKGDSIYFDASVEHGFYNRGKETVEYYLVFKIA